MDDEAPQQDAQTSLFELNALRWNCIRGPSSYRHILIGTDRTIIINGNSPFSATCTRLPRLVNQIIHEAAVQRH